ncbi:hypothetical protein LWI28_007802 [Acer negundo]|uniref:Uncharacterized protein n=1 Tax=Acer negundo TaxID=4023 RepID=A0AAD5NHB7_ACENE|nr:hypothetical protein LWI28_007802 [Acer negundo]
MNLRTAEEDESASVSGREIDVPGEIEWQMLNKWKFFIHGAALFSGVSAVLYPVVVLKTRQQVGHCRVSCVGTAASIVRSEGIRGLYRGFGTSLTGTIPARALYMAALEMTKSEVGGLAVRLGCPEATAAAAANAVGGLSAAVAAQLVWTPVDVVSQRLMVCNVNDPNCRYVNGIDACKKIVRNDGVRGLYRGFGISILTYAPSNAVWWASYSVAQRVVWGGIGRYYSRRDGEGGVSGSEGGIRPDWKMVMAVQGASAAMAGGVTALITMPMDTIKTRMQVLDVGGGGDENNGGGKRGGGPSFGHTVRSLVKEGGWMACYRGLGPRWASMSISATTMITTYEFLKRVSAKTQEVLT